MDNTHPFTKQYLRRNYRKFDSFYVNNHPVMAEIILQDRSIISTGLFANSSPLLTKLIIELFEPTPGKVYYLTMNTNPELSDFIILQESNFDFCCWRNIVRNPNPGLTEFIKKHYQKVEDLHYLNSNTNPELAKLILSRIVDTESLFKNPNTGLTNYLYISRFANIELNTNPGLAPAIINRVIYESLTHNIYQNSNIGLTDYILSHPPRLPGDWSALAANTNPKLERFIYNNKDKIRDDYLHYLASNRYIFEHVRL